MHCLSAINLHILTAINLHFLFAVDTVNSHKKALCPFHVDTKPSLSFKSNRFTCFACGAKGDVIDLVGQITNAEPLAVVRELNGIYHLGIEPDTHVKSSEMQRIQHEREQKATFQKWEHDAARVYAEYIRLLREWRKAFAPKAESDALDFRFIKSLSQLEYFEYIFESVFIGGSDEVKKQFYREHAGDMLVLKEKLEADGCEELLLWHPAEGTFSQAYAAA